MTQKTTFIWISSSLLTKSTLGYVHVKFISELGNYPLDFGKVKMSKVLVTYLVDLSIA